MSQLFKKFFLKLRNTYPFLFYKSAVLEICMSDDQHELSYNYIYDPKKLLVSIDTINNIFDEKEKYDLLYLTVYNSNLSKEDIDKLTEFVHLNLMNENSLFLIFLPDSYQYESKITNDYMYHKIENYEIWMYFKNIEKKDIYL